LIIGLLSQRQPRRREIVASLKGGGRNTLSLAYAWTGSGKTEAGISSAGRSETEMTRLHDVYLTDVFQTGCCLEVISVFWTWDQDLGNRASGRVRFWSSGSRSVRCNFTSSKETLSSSENRCEFCHRDIAREEVGPHDIDVQRGADVESAATVEGCCS
jgi:hypothetical protein